MPAKPLVRTVETEHVSVSCMGEREVCSLPMEQWQDLIDASWPVCLVVRANSNDRSKVQLKDSRQVGLQQLKSPRTKLRHLSLSMGT